jgi:hypothetical protein
MDLRAALLCLGGLLAACSGGGGKGGVEPVERRDDDVNHPPTIAGAPGGTAVVGEYYSFTPAAQDPEGRPLKHAIRFKPPWATFRPSDGRLAGTPGPGDIGSHVDIAISVSDGRSTARLAAFTIDVVGRGDDSATLSWNPPMQNSDGSALTDLAGYRIYYGRRKHRLENAIALDNPGLTRYVVEGLTPGHWYFAMTSVNRGGVESTRSRAVRKKVS